MSVRCRMSSKAYYERIGKKLSVKRMRTLLELREDYEGANSPESIALDFVQNPFYYSFGWGTIDDDLHLKLAGQNFSNHETYTTDPNRFFALAHELLQHVRKQARSGTSSQNELAGKVDEYKAVLGMLARLSANLTPTQVKLNRHAQENHNVLESSFRNRSRTATSIIEYTNGLVNESYRLRDEYWLKPNLTTANAYIRLMTDWYEFARRESRIFDFDKLEACSVMLSSLEAELLLQTV